MQNKKIYSKMGISLVIIFVAIVLLFMFIDRDSMFSPPKKSTTTGCTDSDGGQINSVQGTSCLNFGRLQSQSCSEDECASTTVLREYYCSEDKKSVDREEVVCEFGCEKGICKNMDRVVYIHRAKVGGVVDGKGIIFGASTTPRKEMLKKFDASCLENVYGDFSNLIGISLDAKDLEETCKITVDAQETFTIPTNSNSLFIELNEICMNLNIKEGTFTEQTILTAQEVTISGCDVGVLDFLGMFKEPDFQEYAADFEENKGQYFGIMNSFAETCRNGVIENIEQCDLGWAENDNHGPDCTENCRYPFCGDGYMNPEDGAEECDTNEFSNGEVYMFNPSCPELYGEQASNPDGAVYCTSSCTIDNDECGLID